MTAVRTRVLAGILAAALTATACADDAVDTGLRGVSLEGDESTTTTTVSGETTTSTTTTTIPVGPCRAPQPSPTGWDEDLLAVHAAVTDLAARGASLDVAVRGLGDFSAGWPERAPIGGALYDFQMARYELMADLEDLFHAAGATFIAPGGWTFPGETPLEPLAAAWEAVLIADWETTGLPALLVATSSLEAAALLDAGAVCGLVDGFSDALDAIAAEE